MRNWFVPTAENFFESISKCQIANCLQEMGKETSTAATLKKDKLAQLAESEVKGTGWLPPTLRFPGGKHEASS